MHRIDIPPFILALGVPAMILLFAYLAGDSPPESSKREAMTAFCMNKYKELDKVRGCVKLFNNGGERE